MRSELGACYYIDEQNGPICPVCGQMDLDEGEIAEKRLQAHRSSGKDVLHVGPKAPDQQKSLGKSNMEINLKIATEFTRNPGSRKNFSGEKFLEVLLRPRFVQAQQHGVKLVVDLDGALGYPSSFLKEAFGGLVHEFSYEAVKATLVVVCMDESYLKDEIDKYAQEAGRL
jgi:siroheme synthase (precorrin-2 oxidase/ferrochelatase)